MKTDLHALVWRRYVRMPQGHLLDYAEPDGTALIPTASECENCLPNLMAYTTPIADCAFFGGLYLFALCEQYDHSPDEHTATEIAQIARGLFLLCDVSKVDGFIARGVAQDGVAHYPGGSEDQFGPVILGLWRFFHSQAADEAWRAQITSRLTRALRGMIDAGWHIPSEWENFPLGSFAHADWRGCTMCLFCGAVARELGLLTAEAFESLAADHPDGSVYSRARIVENGFAPDMIRSTGLIQFWIDISAQLSLTQLLTLDPPRAEGYCRGLRANGAAVLPFLHDWKRFSAESGKPFLYDWRTILPEARPWQTPEQAFTEAIRLNRLFTTEAYNPARDRERGTVSQAIYGAWIAIVSGDEEAAAYAHRCLCEAVEGLA